MAQEAAWPEVPSVQGSRLAAVGWLFSIAASTVLLVEFARALASRRSAHRPVGSGPDDHEDAWAAGFAAGQRHCRCPGE